MIEDRGTYSQATVGDGSSLVDRFHEDGYVVICDAIPVDFINAVRESFMRCMEAKRARFKIASVRGVDARHKANEGVKIDFRPEGGNHDLNRWNMHLPTRPEFLDKRLLANEHVMPLIHALLGSTPVAFLLASDTPYPGAGFQSLHQDFPRFGLTLNIPLVDFTEENGPLEVWPGTHVRGDAFHSGVVNLRAKELRDIATNTKSRRLTVPVGSLVIRDQRLVHRGTAHTGDAPRPCLSIWYKNMDRVNLAALQTPIPNRSTADRVARRAMRLRVQGRGGDDDGRIRDRKLLNAGNLLGRLVDEASGSDRDFRRQIPSELWRQSPPEVRSLLRYATVEDGEHTTRGSLTGSALLVGLGAMFDLYALQLAVRRRWNSASRARDTSAS